MNIKGGYILLPLDQFKFDMRDAAYFITSIPRHQKSCLSTNIRLVILKLKDGLQGSNQYLF